MPSCPAPLFFVSLSLLISGCGYAPLAGQQGPYGQPGPYGQQQRYPYQQPYGQPSRERTDDSRDRDRDARDSRDERGSRDDDRRSSRSSRSSRGSDCEGDRKCENMCKEIFRSSRARGKCEDLSVGAVERLFAVFEALEKPKTSDLRDITFDDFDELMQISTAPLEDEIENYSNRETREFLAWVLEDLQTTEFLIELDSDYTMLENLLDNMKTGKPLDGLKSNIDRGTLIEIAIREDEDFDIVLEWIHGYLESGGDKLSECGGSDPDKCTLGRYCYIGNPIKTTYRKKIMDVNGDFGDLVRELVEADSTTSNFDEDDDYKKYCKTSLCNDDGLPSGTYNKAPTFAAPCN